MCVCVSKSKSVCSVFCRASSPSSTVADTLLEAVDVVTGNCISAPAVMATLDVGWAAFEHAQEMLKTCRQVSSPGLPSIP